MDHVHDYLFLFLSFLYKRLWKAGDAASAAAADKARRTAAAMARSAAAGAVAGAASEGEGRCHDVT